jgi:DNA-binding transcriptional MocR family regulator
VIDLSRNLSLPNSLPTNLAVRLRDHVTAIPLEHYLGRDPADGPEKARRIGGEWVRVSQRNDCLVFGGAQLALNVTLAALTQPGDVILADALTFPGLRLAASLHRLRVVVLPEPFGRPQPDAVEAALKRHKPVAWFCIPTLHNPTTICLTNNERRSLAEVANRYRTVVIEDEAYAFLGPPNLRALTEFCDRGVRIVSTAKSLIAGARIAYVAAPSTLASRIRDAGEAMAWMTPPPNTALLTAMIESGLADDIVKWKRCELTRRVTMARSELGRRFICSMPSSLHGWLKLPDHLNATQASALLAERGVLVSPADEFRPMTTRASPAYIRISLGGPTDVEVLTKALGTVSEIRNDRWRQPCR